MGCCTVCDTDFQKCLERHQCHRSLHHHVISDNHWKYLKRTGLDLGLGHATSPLAFDLRPASGRKSRKEIGPVSPSWSRRGWIEFEPHAGCMTCHLLTSVFPESCRKSNSFQAILDVQLKPSRDRNYMLASSCICLWIVPKWVRNGVWFLQKVVWNTRRTKGKGALFVGRIIYRSSCQDQTPELGCRISPIHPGAYALLVNTKSFSKLPLIAISYGPSGVARDYFSATVLWSILWVRDPVAVQLISFFWDGINQMIWEKSRTTSVHGWVQFCYGKCNAQLRWSLSEGCVLKYCTSLVFDVFDRVELRLFHLTILCFTTYHWKSDR